MSEDKFIVRDDKSPLDHEPMLILVSLDDLVRRFNLLNETHALGLRYHGSRHGGAAWTVGNSIFKAWRGLTDDWAELDFDTFDKRLPDPIADRAFTALIKLLWEHGVIATWSVCPTLRSGHNVDVKWRRTTLDQIESDFKNRERTKELGISDNELARWSEVLGQVEKLRGITYQTPEQAVQEFFATLDKAGQIVPGLDKRKESFHYLYGPEKRKEIVAEFRQARSRGKIQDMDAWAQSNYNMSGRTLYRYLDEFPEET